MAYDAMLKITKVEIELLHDISQILFLENQVRGGVSYINERYCKTETVETESGVEDVRMYYIDGKYDLLLSWDSYIASTITIYSIRTYVIFCDRTIASSSVII
jgi:hypothetical protein